MLAPSLGLRSGFRASGVKVEGFGSRVECLGF